MELLERGLKRKILGVFKYLNCRAQLLVGGQRCGRDCSQRTQGHKPKGEFGGYSKTTPHITHNSAIVFPTGWTRKQELVQGQGLR